MRHHLLVVAERPDGDGADRALTSRLEWLADRGWRAQLLVWDRADLGRRLGRFRPVHEVEAINRWRLPQRLERLGLHRPKRLLRNLRIRGWWLRSRRCEVACTVGTLRPELSHYLPPRIRVLRWEADDADREHDSLAAPGHPLHRKSRRRLGLRADGLVVASWGPSAEQPLVGADVFLRLLWTLGDARPDLEVQGLWIGGDERSQLFPSVEHTAHQLGLDAVFHLRPEDLVDPGLAAAVDVLVLCHRGPARAWPTDHLRAVGVPIVRFDQVEPTDGATGPVPDRVAPRPDVMALAGQVAAALEEVVARRRSLEDLLAQIADGPS